MNSDRGELVPGRKDWIKRSVSCLAILPQQKHEPACTRVCVCIQYDTGDAKRPKVYRDPTLIVILITWHFLWLFPGNFIALILLFRLGIYF